MPSPPRTMSPTPSPSPRVSLGITGAEGSTERVGARGSATTSVKDRAQAWATVPIERAPMHDRTAPPTLEELEAMDKEAMETEESEWEEGEGCTTPSASHLSVNSNHNLSVNSKHGPRPYSRQVSRVSGTGKPALHRARSAALPVATGVRDSSARGAPPAQRGRSAFQAPSAPAAVKTEHAPRPATRRNLHRRSTSVDDIDRRPTQRVHAPVGTRRPRNNNTGETKAVTFSGRQPIGRRAPTATAVRHNDDTSTDYTATGAGARIQGAMQAPVTRRAPYSAQGTRSAWQDKAKGPARRLPTTSNIGDTVAASTDDVSPPKLRRRNSAPNFGEALDNVVLRPPAEPVKPVETAEHEQAPSYVASRESPLCWGGGLPPMRNAIAQGPPAARAAAARVPPKAERYPANDRESFARTLNDEELDEVWRGLGEGVSQRGCGSDVAFEPPPEPTSPGTVASGAFPMLTANILERHDQLAVDGGSGSGGGDRPPNVMPIPKEMEDKAAQDMENGTPSSSKKSSRSSQAEQPSLLAAIVSYGVVVLWMAHLVINGLLLSGVVVDHPVWALCFIPGVLGMLLSFISCRRSQGHCKPMVEEEQEERRPTGPHPCALPAHIVLLLSVVVALGMHASAMLFCEKDMKLFIAEGTVLPLCDDRSLLLPVVLDAVLLSVAGLKASSLCWAWVLS